MRQFWCLMIGIFGMMTGMAQTKTVNLKFVETSDVHGHYFSHTFKNDGLESGGLENVYAYLQAQRKGYGDRLLYIDNGDILQGQPTSYYYNFIDTSSVHLAADILNYMGCVAGNMGNHDIETGHAVYDRWVKDCQFPILGANVIDVKTGRPYLKPYVVQVRDGVKIVIFGMITPAIPTWLPETLYKGLYFADMLETAQKWMPVIRQTEKPDVIVGVFHSGTQPTILGGKYNENASQTVAEQVPGFDVVFVGHDHQRAVYKVQNSVGDSVLIVNPASSAACVATADIQVQMENGKTVSKNIDGRLVDMYTYKGKNMDFFNKFKPQYDAVKAFNDLKIGELTKMITTRDAYFGPCEFIDFVHQLQLELTGADISLTAPLSLDASIQKGDIYMSDLFKLYKYENMLYTMQLKGCEIRGALEMSYDMWTNQMKSPDDHILLLDDTHRDDQRNRFKNFSYNFDSAAGIIYTVDVTKPDGEKVNIVSMADGTPFYMDKMYKVAVNSYRGNGGGELLTKGAGLSADELHRRIITSTDKDLRYYMMKAIEQKGIITPTVLNQWKFIPEDWTKGAIERDRKLMFK